MLAHGGGVQQQCDWSASVAILLAVLVQARVSPIELCCWRHFGHVVVSRVYVRSKCNVPKLCENKSGKKGKEGMCGEMSYTRESKFSKVFHECEHV